MLHGQTSPESRWDEPSANSHDSNSKGDTSSPEALKLKLVQAGGYVILGSRPGSSSRLVYGRVFAASRCSLLVVLGI